MVDSFKFHQTNEMAVRYKFNGKRPGNRQAAFTSCSYSTRNPQPPTLNSGQRQQTSKTNSTLKDQERKAVGNTFTA